jgi:hypothetical protein
MTYYADLTPYEFLPDTVPDGVELLNVGWLEPGEEFPTGPTDPEFLANLITLAADHVTAVTRGFHTCRLPHRFEDDFQFGAVYGSRVLFLGHAEIRVTAADGRGLAAPSLVVHYVRDHAYLPPEPFLEAVRAMRVAGR